MTCFNASRADCDLLVLTRLQIAGGDLREVRPAQRLLRRRDHRLRLVARLDQQPRFEVGLRVLERLDEHALHFLVRQAVRRLDLDRLLDVRAQLATPRR